MHARTGWLAAAALAVLFGGCGRAVERPNVVLIVIDTLRADHLGAYGYERATSPNIDALARRSVLFRDATSAASWTNPSLAAVFTGLAPDALGEMPEPIKLGEDLSTLAETLQRNGYSTHGIISHIYLNREHGFAQGFDSWDEDNAMGHTGVTSPSISDRALKRLGALEHDQPFFLFLHYFDPHYDFVEHAEHSFSQGYSGPIASAGDNFSDLNALAVSGALGPADFQHLLDLYDSEIAFTDRHIGRVLDDLERRGLLDNTLVVLTADHGEAFGERPGRQLGHSHTVFQELVRVPLIIKPPGTAPGRVVDAPVSTQDLFATLALELDLSSARAWSTPSLLAPPREDAPLFTTTYAMLHLDAVRQGRWKLVHDLHSGEGRLFDLSTDPGETIDRSGEQPDIVARLEALRLAWREQNAAGRALLDLEAASLSEAELERLRQLGYAR